MKRGALLILMAIFFSLSFVSQETLAKNSGNVAVTDKPDLTITDAKAIRVASIGTVSDTVKFTVVSHNYTVPANTITVVILALPHNQKALYDIDWTYESLIEQTIPAEQPTEITIKLPSDKPMGPSKQFSVIVDYTNKVDESDEGNNVVTKDIPPSSSPFPNTADAKLKDVIYFTPKGTKTVRTGTPTAPLKIAKSQTPGCHSGKCNATLTVRVLKTPTTDSQGVDVKITNAETGGEWDGSVTFESNQTVKDVPIMVSLHDGENKLKVKITMVVTLGGDPDESNNTLEFTIILIEG